MSTPGDPDKRPATCKEPEGGYCENLKEISAINDFDGETYKCDVCGRYYRLYYDEMR